MNFNAHTRYIPDEIRGDLDSIRSDVREYYESKVRIKIYKNEKKGQDWFVCL